MLSRALKACRLRASVSSCRIHGWTGNARPPLLTMQPESFSSRTLSTSVHPPEDNKVRWRYPVDDRTNDMINRVRYGIVVSTQILTMNAAVPISHELMEEAFNILYDKLESLRICFRLRENQLWVADMPCRRLDFGSVSGSDLQKQHSDLGKSSFDLHNGPLWKARLMTCPPNAPCQFPEVKAKFPYQYDILLSLHHGANDGFVLHFILELLPSIVDNLLQGLPVDRQQIGELRDNIEAREEENRIKAALENDPARLKEALRQYEMTKRVPLLVEAFGTPNEEKPFTADLPPVFIDSEIMRKIGEKCRSLGVTINSFMTAVLNTALVEVVRDAGLKRSSYTISSKYPVNGRRLMKKSTKPYLGFHNILMTQVTTTPHNVKQHFWGYVKNLDTEVRDKLQRNYMCEETVLSDMVKPAGYTEEAFYSQPFPVSCDYSFSNVYSPRSSVQGIGKLVQLTNSIAHNDIHRAYHPLLFVLLGFRGQGHMSMMHSTATISKEVAERYVDKTFAVLHDIMAVA